MWTMYWSRVPSGLFRVRVLASTVLGISIAGRGAMQGAGVSVGFKLLGLSTCLSASACYVLSLAGHPCCGFIELQ
jgi:hypothetical protein